MRRCRALSYGDLAASGPQLSSAARVNSALRMTMQVRAMRSFDLRAGVSVKSGGAVGWARESGSELRRGRLRSDQTGERLFGEGTEILIMRCRSGSSPEVASGDA